MKTKTSISFKILWEALDGVYVKYEDSIYRGNAMIIDKETIGIKIQLSEYSWTSKLCKIDDYKKSWALREEDLL